MALAATPDRTNVTLDAANPQPEIVVWTLTGVDPDVSFSDSFDFVVGSQRVTVATGVDVDHPTPSQTDVGTNDPPSNLHPLEYTKTHGTPQQDPVDPSQWTVAVTYTPVPA